MSRMRTALVTGAAQGIGLATAKQFSERGWQVFGLDIKSESLNEEAGKVGFSPIVCDLSDAAAIESLAWQIDKLDLLVNNAATSYNTDPRNLSISEWNRVIAVNLTAPFLLSRLFADKLQANRGSIVNIASTRALMSEPFTEAYSASKGGLLSLTHAMAMSLAPVRVNAISPGWIEHYAIDNLSEKDHSFHPVGRVGNIDDIANMTWYLASSEAGFITGQNFVIDGGVSRKMIYP